MKVNDCVIYKGARKPVNLYQGAHKITGWRWHEQSGTDMPFEATYNDRVDVVALGRSKQATSVQGKNLFNGVLALGSVLSSTGELASAENRVRSGYIAVQPSTQYRLSGVEVNPEVLVYYDADKNYIAGTTAPTKQLTTPSNCHYVLFRAFSIDTSARFQLELGSVATAYEPFVPNSPSPDYPSPIIASEGIIRSEDCDGNGVQIDTGILRAIPDGAGGWAARDREYIARVGSEWHRMREQRVGRRVYDDTDQCAVYAANNGYTCFSLPLTGYSVSNRSGLSTHAPIMNFVGSALQYVCAYNYAGGGAHLLVMPSTLASTVDGIRAWLAAQAAAGTPYVHDYVLATPIETDLGPIDLPSYYPFTRVLVEGEYPPDTTVRCRVLDN